jgi:hypothetical protein
MEKVQMSLRSRFARLAGALTLAVAVIPAVGQQQISFPDFTSTSGLSCNGSAQSALPAGCTTSGTALELTSANPSQSGSAWFSNKVPLAGGFTTSFQFQLNAGEGTPADGIAFVIQNSSLTALGDPSQGGNIGYGNEGTDDTGFPSLAVEFDTFPNSWDGPNTPHVAIQSCGASVNNSPDHTATCKLALSGAVPYLSDGQLHNVTIKYLLPTGCSPTCPDPTLSVILDGTQVATASVNLVTKLSLDASGDAWVGFTGGTGAAFETQDILNWNLSAGSGSTTLPPSTVSNDTPTVTATFIGSEANNNLVQHVLDFSALTGNIPDGTELTPADQGVTTATWPQYVAGSPFATTSCIPRTGQDGKCSLYTDLCTSSTNTTPSGANCPQSSQNNIIIEDVFDATPKPSSTLPGAGFGLLMGGDNWSSQGQSSCIFGGPETGASCPQDILTSFSGDASTSSGSTKSLNSTFVSVSNLLMPTTAVAVSPNNSYGWTNSTTPSISFTTDPPGIGSGTPVPLDGDNHPVNGYIAAPIASLSYNVNGAVTPPNPISATPITNSLACFVMGDPGSVIALQPAAAFPAAAGPVSLHQGTNAIQYSAKDCAGISELAFSFDTPSQTWSTTYKSWPIYVDTVAPTVGACLPAPTNTWLGANVTVSCTVNDSTSGFAPPLNPLQPGSPGSNSTTVMLATTVATGTENPSAQTGMNAGVSDLAGNPSPAIGPIGPYKIDLKAPTITAVTPAQNSTQSYYLNQAVNATYNCSDLGSGVKKCGTITYATPVQGTTANVVSSVNTALVGQGKPFTVSANDAVGNSATSALFTYNVNYLFIGFLTLQQPPLTNPLKAGKATAILFDVQDGKIKPVSGLKLAPTGTVTVSETIFSTATCSGSSTGAVFNGTMTGLPLGAYSLNWTPPSSLAGKCVTLGVNLGDGISHKVNLKF